MHNSTLEQSLEAFTRELYAKNRSEATSMAYRCDVQQFINWLHENNLYAVEPGQVEKQDIVDYLYSLAERKVSGTSRARKLTGLRTYFKHCEEAGLVKKSPAAGVDLPKKEKKVRTWLQPTEYKQLLAEAAGNPRDYAILQVFLQTGVRVSELCALRIDDISFVTKTLIVREGKGGAGREIECEKKVLSAVASYLKARPNVDTDVLFLNRDNQPLSERGVRKLLAKYVSQAKLGKKASPHSLRHTFATFKAEANVSPYQLQRWLGHKRLESTQIYVHIGKQNARRMMEGTSL